MTAIKRTASIIFILLYLPVLASIIFLGNKANYPDYYKLDTIVPNWVLFIAALLLAIVFFFLAKTIDSISLTPKTNLIFDLALALAFVVITVINIKLCKSLVFVTGWADPVNAQYSGLRINEGISINEGTWYYLLCSNNVPIAYICSLILRLMRFFPNFPYQSDFFIIEVNCVIISLAGFFTVLTAKKLSRKFGTAVVAFLIYAALICVSPWKLFFYTDTAGMLLPIITFYVYLAAKGKDGLFKHVFTAIYAFTGILAGMIKPTAYTCLIAIVIVEMVEFVARLIKKEGRILETAVLIASVIAAFLLINVGLKAHIYNVAGFTPDKDLEGTWTYYLNMGSNEEYMGTNNPVDSGLLVGEYSGRPGSERRAAEIESFMTRTRDRGFWGNLSFWNRKLTMTFNDGTFSWYKEGIAAFYAGEYEDISANPKKELLRNIFWGDGEYYNYYETYAQWLWIFVLTGMAGVGFVSFYARNRQPFAFHLTVICIGVILFQMLFETRGRYLICSLPLLIIAGVEGYRFYATLKDECHIFRKQEFKNREEEE